MQFISGDNLRKEMVRRFTHGKQVKTVILLKSVNA